ncbi:MAG: site-specific integrase [Pseudomonadota bacterium]
MLESLFAKFDGAYAPRTIDNYRSDFANFTNFTKWCEAQGIDTLEVSPSELARFIDAMMPRWSSSTIKHHIAAINTIYRLSDRVPIGDTPEVLLALKRFHRKKGNWQKQASPVTREILIKLLAVCDDSVHGLRDRVLLRLGYESLARHAELCSFRFEDLYQRPDWPAAINLRFAKNDQFGDGRLIPIRRICTQTSAPGQTKPVVLDSCCDE